MNYWNDNMRWSLKSVSHQIELFGRVASLVLSDRWIDRQLPTKSTLQSTHLSFVLSILHRSRPQYQSLPVSQISDLNINEKQYFNPLLYNFEGDHSLRRRISSLCCCSTAFVQPGTVHDQHLLILLETVLHFEVKRKSFPSTLIVQDRPGLFRNRMRVETHTYLIRWILDDRWLIVLCLLSAHRFGFAVKFLSVFVTGMTKKGWSVNFHGDDLPAHLSSSCMTNRYSFDSFSRFIFILYYRVIQIQRI